MWLLQISVTRRTGGLLPSSPKIPWHHHRPAVDATRVEPPTPPNRSRHQLTHQAPEKSRLRSTTTTARPLPVDRLGRGRTPAAEAATTRTTCWTDLSTAAESSCRSRPQPRCVQQHHDACHAAFIRHYTSVPALRRATTPAAKRLFHSTTPARLRHKENRSRHRQRRGLYYLEVAIRIKYSKGD